MVQVSTERHRHAKLVLRLRGIGSEPDPGADGSFCLQDHQSLGTVGQAVPSVSQSGRHQIVATLVGKPDRSVMLGHQGRPRRKIRVLGQSTVETCERLLGIMPRSVQSPVPIPQELGDEGDLKRAASPQPDRLVLPVASADVHDLFSPARVRRRLPGETECLRSSSRYRPHGSGPVGGEKLPGSGQLDREPVLTCLGSGWKVAAILRREDSRASDCDGHGCNGQQRRFGCSAHSSSPPNCRETTVSVLSCHPRGMLFPVAHCRSGVSDPPQPEFVKIHHACPRFAEDVDIKGD